MVSFSLAEQADVSLVVYNTLGQPARTLVQSRMNAGFHTIRWNGRNDAGRAASSGIYFVRRVAVDYSSVTRMTLVR
jgi:flagellar hook assembly protein FlgD